MKARFAISPGENREKIVLQQLLAEAGPEPELRKRITGRAIELVEHIRSGSRPGMMELFLAEYGLSTDEGVALMCLAEALLRVPDGDTIDALIEDKVAPSEWGKHLGQSHSPLVNASTWALFLTGKVLDDEETSPMAGILHGAIKRLGEPIIRQAVTRAMKEMGRQFVLGETIEKAMSRAAANKEKEGFTYSYDMLGEAARTERDAKRYHLAYSDAIGELAKVSNSDDIRDNPGISIKLSALHPRYETLKHERVMTELVPRARSLAILAKSAGIGFNIDAEEAARLEISMDVIEAILSDPVLKGWDGFGVVVQAYGIRAPQVLDWLHELARKLDRKIMVRLVKGAYWDTEIKLSQVEGHEAFPVFTQKASTDVSYICCARKLLSMTDHIYPQFATHNAHTVAAILEMAEDRKAFEFQRLHGMGEALHDAVLKQNGTRCRIYAPVGAHKDLLAYLVRRLLENGANSSFVNQIVDEDVPAEEVAADPFGKVETWINEPHNPAIRMPADLFQPERQNSRGWDLNEPATLLELESGMAPFRKKTWNFAARSKTPHEITSPATGNPVGRVKFFNADEAGKACNKATPWSGTSARERAGILRKTAALYEENAHEIFALLSREAGKTLLDCVGELREAVDFLRFYAKEAEKGKGEALGVFGCISPWNFPLAIFTGQISAALAAGNGVVAKPAESTPLIASLAVSLMHKAGVPKPVLQLLAGTGREVGSILSSHPRIAGICFTGSTATAQTIHRSMASHLLSSAPLIAETGGLNAMIVDSTALPEQAVRDVLASAFQSAGQRCSALRVLYIQEDVADTFLTMLFGAMDELKVDDPAEFDTDVGPVIDKQACAKIEAHIAKARESGRLMKETDAPGEGNFVAPTVIRVNGIADLEEEIFGPVLHIATFKGHEIDSVIEQVNATGYGLTFGLHTRIDDRVQHIVDHIEAGNIYVNRNQIGAVVGSQPFGGEGLSGTGPKAGGPLYLKRFMKPGSFEQVSPVAKPVELPGPTGESNRYSTKARRHVLCLGPGSALAEQQAETARGLGCEAVIGDASDLTGLNTKTLLDAVVLFDEDAGNVRTALAERAGPIVPLLANEDFAQWLVTERHVCIDTTAAGGNAELIGS